jgi:hypothetical protein
VVYPYRKTDGSEYFEKCRYQNGPKKTFSLRHKLEDVPAQPKYLTTETGIGYRFLL